MQMRQKVSTKCVKLTTIEFVCLNSIGCSDKDVQTRFSFKIFNSSPKYLLFEFEFEIG